MSCIDGNAMLRESGGQTVWVTVDHGERTIYTRTADGPPKLIMGGVKFTTPPPAPLREPCKYLGERVGEVKVVCNQPPSALHECLHPERPAKTLRNKLRPPRALPATSCDQMNGHYQACATCGLWELLTNSSR